MWVELICGFVAFRLLRRFFCDDDDLDGEAGHANALFSVAGQLEKLYGGKVFVGLQIPDADSGSRRSIDLVLVTQRCSFGPLASYCSNTNAITGVIFAFHHLKVDIERSEFRTEVAVISVKNVSGSVHVDKDGSWVCTGRKTNKMERLPDPVAETKQLVPILESYLEQRGVPLPEGYLSSKVICPNPNFQTTDTDFFPSEVITYDQWIQLKPEHRSRLSGWIKGAFQSGKKDMQESMQEKLNFILSTAPMWDRLELKNNKYVLGEFLEFKGKKDDILALRNIKRSKVSQLVIQRTSICCFAHSKLQVLYSPRDYRGEGASASDWKEVCVFSSTEVLFQPQGSSKVRKYKLSSVTCMSLSA
nr:Plasma membrane isoform 1 [Ipomoea batatas]